MPLEEHMLIAFFKGWLSGEYFVKMTKIKKGGPTSCRINLKPEYLDRRAIVIVLPKERVLSELGNSDDPSKIV